MGMSNQLGKFSQQLFAITQSLLSMVNLGTEPRKSIPESERRERYLHCMIPKERQILSCALFYGLGAVSLQKTEKGWHPIAYASGSMSATECRYTQIQEALAITRAF